MLQQAEPATEPLSVFINYRRDDAAGEALVIYSRLAAVFGSERVFFDTHSLEPGMKWLETIKTRAQTCGVFLALIGDRWAPTLRQREQQAVAAPADDYVRLEIEYALQRKDLTVIPVLIDDAPPPMADRLPRSLQPLAALQVEQIRRSRFQQDLEHLVERLKAIARERPEVKVRAESDADIEVPPPAPQLVAPPPDAEHLDLVLDQMINVGDVVTLLGPRLKPAQPLRQSADVSSSYPDAEELAADLARRFKFRFDPVDLAEVAQYVYMITGRPGLYRTLTQIYASDRSPGPVHRFFARLPGMLAAAGREKRYQLLVSTTFDMALERAFDAEGEPYDLAVYMASGPDEGRFVHFPYDREPEPIVSPNSYGKFPIGDYGELSRTVIVKIHGAVDGRLGNYRWRENYVITEDHYIDYLSRSPVENLVPVQILEKLRDSHCLFLGYTMRDWNLRVFLKRIWRGAPLSAKSWAIERETNQLEKEFWLQSHVELYTSDLTDYVRQLRRRLYEVGGDGEA